MRRTRHAEYQAWLHELRDTRLPVAPGVLDAVVRSLGEHLAVSRDLLIAPADPLRQDLVQLHARAELNVGEIAERVTLSRPRVSHHVNMLRRAGLVRVRKHGREMYTGSTEAHHRHIARPAR